MAKFEHKNPGHREREAMRKRQEAIERRALRERQEEIAERLDRLRVEGGLREPPE